MFTVVGETQEPGLGARGVNKQGIVAGHRNAPDEVQELLEIQLPVTIQIEFLHHPVHDTWVLLILQKTKEMGIDVCLEAKMPLCKEPPCPHQWRGTGRGRQNSVRPTLVRPRSGF